MCIRAAHDGPHGAAPPPLRGVQAQLQDLQQPQEAQALRPQPGQAVRLPGLPSQVYIHLFNKRKIKLLVKRSKSIVLD
jgi:hypothetical protein